MNNNESKSKDDTKISFDFVGNLNDILNSRQIKPAELARMTGLSKAYIYELLKSTKNAELGTLIKICKALDISLTYFMLSSLHVVDREEKKKALLDKIKPLLIEIEDLIYPDDDSDSNEVLENSKVFKEYYELESQI